MEKKSFLDELSVKKCFEVRVCLSMVRAARGLWVSSPCWCGERGLGRGLAGESRGGRMLGEMLREGGKTREGAVAGE